MEFYDAGGVITNASFAAFTITANDFLVPVVPAAFNGVAVAFRSFDGIQSERNDADNWFNGSGFVGGFF
jgi:hypothetical protein